MENGRNVYGVPMSYTTPAGPQRAGTVTAATAMMYVLALLRLIVAGLAIYTATFYTKSNIITVYQGGGADPAVAHAAASFFEKTYYASVVFTVVLAAVYFILAIFVGRGRREARIASWVIVGLFDICFGASAVAINARGTGVLNGLGTNSGIDQKVMQQKLLELIPDWVVPAQLALGILGLAAASAVVILLALPSSNTYFRRVPEWVPRKDRLDPQELATE